MRTTLLLAVLIMLACSCKKDNIEISQFYGTWELRSSSGFLSPWKSYEPGNGNYIELKSDGTINRYENAIPTSSETFNIIKKDITACKWNTSNYLAIDYGSGSHEQIHINNDTLQFSTPPCSEDGGTVTYIRVNK